VRDLLVAYEFLAPQGEGRNTGRLSYWVRLGGCNQHCRWCDSPETWVFTERKAAQHEGGKLYDVTQELSRHSIEDIAGRIYDSPARAVTFTGGEPLLQAEPLLMLLNELDDRYLIDFETAGTVPPGHLKNYPVQFTVSPKLASSGNEVSLRRNPDAISQFLQLDSVFKFVIDTRTPEAMAADLDEAVMLVSTWRIPAELVWLSPCGTSTPEVIDGMKLLEPACLSEGFNLSSRLQVLMHGNERGH
jgi:7-carboxy-7-deazaguanine synthase